VKTLSNLITPTAARLTAD